MISAKFDTKDFSSKMINLDQYSKGFLNGINANRINFNNQLAMLTKEALEKFIDARARADKPSLHHVYEWNMTGNPAGRLFKIDHQAGTNIINFFGNFLPSSSVSDSSDEPFINKAEIMENQIQIQVEPRMNSALAFEDNGEQVFSMNSITIDNPGGDAVSGSFGRAVEDFFNIYFTTTFLTQSGILQNLQNPIEYAERFAAGVKGAGYSAGMSSASKYMSIKGGIQ